MPYLEHPGVLNPSGMSPYGELDYPRVINILSLGTLSTAQVIALQV